MARVAVAGGTGTLGGLLVSGLRDGGHEAVVLARSTGVDLLAGTSRQLLAALEGCSAVVDATGPTSRSGSLTARGSRAFFGRVTTTLLGAGRAAGVGHHVALSIVGAARVDAGYYAGKALQERLVALHDGGWSLVRATQFHEFVPRLAAAAPGRPFAVVPRFVSQPVAAAEVATELAGLAVGTPRGAVAELAGPRVEALPDLARRWLAATGGRAHVLPVELPGTFGRAVRRGGALPGPGARLGVQTFDDWLRAGPATR